MSASLVRNIPFPVSGDPVHIIVNYSFVFGTSWVECGISKTHELLRAIGFATSQEVSAFCASRDVFKTFSTEVWIRKYVNDSDRKLIASATGKNKFVLLPNTLPNYPTATILNGTYPNYEDFFQVLFTWLSQGDTLERRNNFIAWWANPEQALNSSLRNPYASFNDSSLILKSFKDEVDNFLVEYRKPKPKSDTGSGSPFVDGIHYVETKLLDLLLTESQWRYVSGDEGSIGLNLAAAELGVSAGGGYYYIYHKNSPKEYYTLRFGQFAATGGASLSFPVNVGVNLALLPDSGKIYQAWSSVSNASNLTGIYLYISGSYGLITNVSSNLVFFLPVANRIPSNLREIAEDTGAMAATLLTSIGASKAVMVTNGHAFELSLGAGAAVGYGYVHVGSKFTIS